MEEQERQWIRGIQRGEREAFKEVFYAYHPRLCAFATEYATSHDAAHDIVQEVFLKLWQRREEWHIRDSLQAYLYQAVRNRALNHIRNKKTRRQAKIRMASAKPICENRTAEDQAHFKELTDAIQDAIAGLPERRREAFVLHRRHDLTHAEVAEIMDISPKTVENQIGRALKFLRCQLSSHFLPEEIKR